MTKVTRNQLYQIVGARIKEARERTGLTRQQLARRCCLSSPYLWHVEENGARISLDSAIAIAHALDMSIDDLIADLELLSQNTE